MLWIVAVALIVVAGLVKTSTTQQNYREYYGEAYDDM